MLERTTGPTPVEPGPSNVPVGRERPPGDGADGEAGKARLLQVLATEHWSLLATRSLTWNESFSRAAMYLTSLSAAVVALALVSQATDFGEGFVLFALVILPFVLFIGATTFVRLVGANNEDVLWVGAMNRIRHAYTELAPDSARYLSTGTTDDERGVMLTYSGAIVPSRIGPVAFIAHAMTTTPGMIGTINAMVGAVFAGLAAVQAGSGMQPSLLVGGVVFALLFVAHLGYASRALGGFRRLDPRFPTPPDAVAPADRT